MGCLSVPCVAALAASCNVKMLQEWEEGHSAINRSGPDLARCQETVYKTLVFSWNPQASHQISHTVVGLISKQQGNA